MEDKMRKRTQKAGEVWDRFEAEMRRLVGDLTKEELPPD
jgi:hypothetical protein